MSDSRKFKFVSPGIFLNEIDQSQIQALPDNVGPVIIGRTEKGPGMTPTKVESFSEFVAKFGNPIAGRGGARDVWRDGNYSSPTYAAYAAQAYLRAGVGPVTMVRLMGTQSPDATSAGYAGWQTSGSVTAAIGTNGGAYGLFVWASGTAEAFVSGTLAAVWYLDSGAMALSGTLVESSSSLVVGPTPHNASGSSVVISSDSNGHFQTIIYDESANEVKNAVVSLRENDKNFVRNVFNTNPQLVSSIELSANQTNYWLGESYERYVEDLDLNGSTMFGAIMAVADAELDNNSDMSHAYRDSHSGWFFAQNRNTTTSLYAHDNMEKLFKFIGINGHGAWLQNNIKVSIANIKASPSEHVPYGTFDVFVREADDSDIHPKILERYTGCNLDPGSLNYVAAKIGDTRQDWDETEKRYREFGNYPNRSDYIRVVMDETIDNGGASTILLPFGVYGPPRFTSWTWASGTSGTWSVNRPSSTAQAYGGDGIPHHFTGNAHQAGGAAGERGLIDMDSAAPLYVGPAGAGVTASISYPAVAVRHSCSSTTYGDGTDATKNAYFGLQTGKSYTSTQFDTGYGDYLRCFSRDIIADSAWGDTYGISGYAGLSPQWVFSLDDVSASVGTGWSATTPARNINDAAWFSGSMVGGTSMNAGFTTSGGTMDTVYTNILDAKINRFTSPLWGGFDGLNITERDPFRNSSGGLEDGTETSNYAYYSIRRAIDTIADPEVIEMNAASLPGITNEGLTKYLIDTCEQRADALAVIDLTGGFQPRHESNSDVADRKGDLDTVISNIKARNLNSSYGACYYPWVKVRDDINGTFLDMPPSVVALGVLASTERAADVWFAPAGFRRGGLSTGAGGVSVIGVETKLTSANRDDLYEVNINPIASFPAEGIVVFGQKTLQATQSALDRINVRRLMIFVKRGISRISSQTLFQPNVQATWGSFKSKADNFLADVKVRFGVDDYRVILDETTTTSDLIDRNIMYAKIFIKPTRAIEFIAIDFIITRSGASFED
jgi:hypothetical protein